jgi:hypothetical protein
MDWRTWHARELESDKAVGGESNGTCDATERRRGDGREKLACASDMAFGIVYNTAEGVYVMRDAKEGPSDCLYNTCITTRECEQ